MAENNRDTWKYFVSLGATVVVTSGAVAMMMCTVLLPHWYYSDAKHPRTDVGLFHECFSEGLNKGCHAFTDNAGMEYYYHQVNYTAKYQVIVR